MDPKGGVPLDYQLSRNASARVCFGNSLRQKAFFLQARRSYASWKDLLDNLRKLTKIHLTPRKLRRWRLGQALPVLDVVQAICDLTGEDLSQLVVEIKAPNWGQQKGGNNKVAKCGCNLTLQRWIKGGRKTGRSNSVSHMKAIASIGGSVAIKSNTHPFRTVNGPKGIKMLDTLERDVMAKLVSAGFDATYEPVVKIGVRRLIPDFRVGGTYIECTRNRKVNAKSAELIGRFRALRKHVAFHKGVVVTLPSLVDRYRYYLMLSDIDVTTADNLAASIV